ncbi:MULTISPECIES: hypothetical protein [unclassified Haloferax]|uniref:DUF7526 family protein n=1 Tax=Haloferax TaxID=2251 RepID=UPI0002B14D9A|nr:MULTISPECIES: hypothetical protein [unclassified Haloferax]ELZ60279.1 hypothetical protein C460_05190 [Haloferax sp. ATCC BAA-646]ELZ64491.1 hypothetical protein C459_08180 [Haloferax sp. ATCC BAA-645]ELZ69674.1 hypothetical protein C458_05319 [Haloferax sp. ATCC BAA-644]
MTETIRGDVLHAIPPDELDDEDLSPELRALADSRHVLVVRKGGHPSMLDLVWAFVRRDPIEAVTVVTDRPAEENEEVALTVEETGMPGVYVAAGAHGEAESTDGH